jgi:hypothetical protein
MPTIVPTPRRGTAGRGGRPTSEPNASAALAFDGVGGAALPLEQDASSPRRRERPGLTDTPDVLAFNKAYPIEFAVALAASHNAAELLAAMKQNSPQASLDQILNFTAARFCSEPGLDP